MKKLILFLVMIAFAMPVFASSQQDQLAMRRLFEKLDRLESDMQTLQQYVYKGQIPIPTANSSSSSPVHSGDMEVRMSELEEKMRILNGNFEQINHNIAQLNEKLELLKSDTEFRFSEVGGANVNPTETTTTTPNAADNQLRLPEKNTEKSQLESPAKAPIATELSIEEQLSALRTPKEQYDFAYGFVKQNQLDNAEKAFTLFISKNPKTKLLHGAYFWLGEVYYDKKDYNSSATQFLKAYKENAKGSKAAESLAKLAMSLDKLNKGKEACGTIAKLEKEFPQDGSINKVAKLKTKLNCGGGAAKPTETKPQ